MDASKLALNGGAAPAEVDAEEGLLEAIAGRSSGAALHLASGRTVVAEAAPEGDRLIVRSASGEVELQVTLTAQGPLLRFRAADLELTSPGDVRVACNRFEVHAADSIEHRSGGDLREIVGKDRTSRVREASTTVAAEVSIEAARAGVTVTANDDVVLSGERIKLNC